MSIIEKSNPLNLQYRVCIVTSASSPLGVIICKTLLKANALVLGLDEHAKDDSLNAGLGTHFQFMQCNIEDDAIPTQALKAAEAGFGTDRLDVLVNVVDRDDQKAYQNLCQVVGTVMKERETASIINVPSGNVKDIGSFMAASMETGDMSSIRQNLVVPRQTTEDPDQDGSRAAYREAKAHMTALMKTEKITRAMTSAVESKHAAAMLYDIGNVTLFLAGDMSSRIDRKQVYLDGSCQAL